MRVQDVMTEGVKTIAPTAISIACPSAGGTVVTLQLPGERMAALM